jgi:hypothetical protein
MACYSSCRRAAMLALVCAILASALPPGALAHHGSAHYTDEDDTQILEGVVKGFDWRAPHCWLTLTVTNAAGEDEDWLIELNSPGRLLRLGWTRNSVAAGDRVAATVRPLRTGAAGGLLRRLEHENGEVYTNSQVLHFSDEVDGFRPDTVPLNNFDPD